MIGLPPLLLGAVQLTSAWLEAGRALTPVGADGAAKVTQSFETGVPFSEELVEDIEWRDARDVPSSQHHGHGPLRFSLAVEMTYRAVGSPRSKFHRRCLLASAGEGNSARHSSAFCRLSSSSEMSFEQ